MFVVTGGGSGIGKALAVALTQRGKNVLIVGRRQRALAETAACSPLISTLCADVAMQEGRQLIASYLHDFSQIEGLVHNAGIIDPIMPISSIDNASWERVMAVNLNAPLFLSQLLLDKLAKGRILHIGSGAAEFPVTGWSAYCVSKAALSMLTRCWQLEHTNPAIANVKPGIIDTDMQALIRESNTMDEEKVAFFKELKQDNRLLTPETVALFLTWLLLDVDKEDFQEQEWDIYDKTHHALWLVKPHLVPKWE
jgi:benzil reductase ((S)-benzoin forming)